MTGKDTNMTASELLLKAAEKTGPDCFLCHEVFSIRCNDTCGRWCSLLADKIDAELIEARAEGISEGVDVSLIQGAMLWAKANGWPDFRDGEDFGAWLDRCTYKKPVDDHNEPVQFGEEIELHHRDGSVDKGRFQEATATDGPVWVLSFTGVDHEHLYRYDSEFDVIKRPVPEALGADGLPIKVGETAYDTKTGIEIVVSRIAKDEGDNVIVCASGDICELQFDPRHITHTHPDTQERIDADATRDPRAYYNDHIGHNVGLVDDAGVYEAVMAHLLKRQRELDKRTGGE